MYCLETSVIIDILRGDDSLKDKIAGVDPEEIVITTITLCELYKGAYAYYDSDKKIRDVDEFIENFEVVGIDENSSREFGKIYSKLKKEGKLINDFDMMIAAIVKTNDLILVTRDNDFNDLGIGVERW
jgi:predicted nucleic acid-binding protein